MQGDKTVYDLGNGIEIHVTRDGKVLHIILSEPSDEHDITNTTLGILLRKQENQIRNEPQGQSSRLQ
jgi:hypothetical protein